MFMLHHNRSITVVLQQSNIFAMPWMHREYNFGGAPPFVVLLMCSLAGGLLIESGRGPARKLLHGC
jgi:hypothetical protein